MTRQTTPSRKTTAAAASPASDTQNASRKLQPSVRFNRRQIQAAMRPTRNGSRKKLGQARNAAVSSFLCAPTNQVTAPSSAPPTAFAAIVPKKIIHAGFRGGSGGGASMADMMRSVGPPLKRAFSDGGLNNH